MILKNLHETVASCRKFKVGLVVFFFFCEIDID